MIKGIILTTQRSGSTFIAECLQSHPEVLCPGELLQKGFGYKVPDYIFRFRNLTKVVQFFGSGAWNSPRMMDRFFATGNAKARVFKAMYNHLAFPWTRRYLERHPEIRIIHLRRDNLLKQYVSFLLMGRPRVKHWQPHVIAPIPAVRVHVPPDAALAYMRRTVAQYQHFEQVFAKHRRMPLVYEETIDGNGLRQDVADAICDFLEVSRRPMSSPLVKVNPDDLSEMVTNYDELAAAVRHSEFARLLD
jgi:LPS sulfotransferase NodH